jgi:hypothetical protein
MSKLLFLLLLVTANNLFAQSNTMVLVGPKLNINISKTDRCLSGGLEVSTWSGSMKDGLGGTAFGFEFEKGRFRVYADLQAGYIIGFSVGPVVEISSEKTKLGFQGSMWGVLLLGGELKYRRINSTNYFAPGFLLKIPVYDNGVLDFH